MTSVSGPRPLALVREPSSLLAQGELTHLERRRVDVALAREQWIGYCDALADNGFTVVPVDRAEEHPDSVFIEDPLVVLGETAVVTRPGFPPGEETTGAWAAAQALGLTTHEITGPGHLDGGDVLKVGRRIYVGRGGRTDEEGIRQFAAIASPLGYDVRLVAVTKVLHLKSSVTALPDGTVVGFVPHVDEPERYERFVALPEPGAAVLVLEADAVLMADSTPGSIRVIEDLGYRVVTVDISEFEKLEGCVTCLSVRVR